MNITITAKETLNDANLIKHRDMWLTRLQRLFDGEAIFSREKLFSVYGIVGISDIQNQIYTNPELWVINCLENFAENAYMSLNHNKFSPLCIECDIYGVHFIDSIFGCEIFFQDGQWYNKYLTTDIGALVKPDLNKCEAWLIAQRVAKEFIRQGVSLPLFGLPTISSALNVAVNLYGDEILAAMLSEPAKAKHDLEIINITLCEIHTWYRQVIPESQLQSVLAFERVQPPGYGQICGCTTQLISGDVYKGLIAPLDNALLAQYPKGGMIHLCGSHEHIIPHLRDMPNLKAVQVNDQAAIDFEKYHTQLRRDQVIYFMPCDDMPIQQAIKIKGGDKMVIQKPPIGLADNPVPITTSHDNPLINIHCNPDPYAIFHDGMYYCYSTGYHGVNVLRSYDLTSFKHMGFALSDESQIAYWAPAVIFHDGLFYMYYSSILKGETDPHKEFMRVAVADNPMGPFVYKKTLYHEFSIDPHVIVKNGELYMFYAANITSGEKIGTMVLLDKMLDPFTPECKPRIVVAPSIEQEVFAKDRFGDGRDWYTIEGAFYFEEGDTGYLMYSANAFMHGDYFVGYATCDANLPLDKAVFSKYPSDNEYSPLIGKDANLTGCGHNSMIKGPSGELLIVYHGRARAEKNPPSGLDDGRQLCISEVEIKGKCLQLVPRQQNLF